jgi:hypothetical protein
LPIFGISEAQRSMSHFMLAFIIQLIKMACNKVYAKSFLDIRPKAPAQPKYKKSACRLMKVDIQRKGRQDVEFRLRPLPPPPKKTPSLKTLWNAMTLCNNPA